MPPRGPREPDERLADWVDGRLSPRDLERFEAELRVNPELKKVAERYRADVERIRGALRAPLPRIDVAAAVLQKLQAAPARPTTPRRSIRGMRRGPLLVSLCAAAALLATALLLQQWQPPPPPASTSTETARHVVESLDDSRKEVDGGLAKGEAGEDYRSKPADGEKRAAAVPPAGQSTQTVEVQPVAGGLPATDKSPEPQQRVVGNRGLDVERLVTGAPPAEDPVDPAAKAAKANEGVARPGQPETAADDRRQLAESGAKGQAKVEAPTGSTLQPGKAGTGGAGAAEAPPSPKFAAPTAPVGAAPDAGRGAGAGGGRMAVPGGRAPDRDAPAAGDSAAKPAPPVPTVQTMRLVRRAAVATDQAGGDYKDQGGDREAAKLKTETKAAPAPTPTPTPIDFAAFLRAVPGPGGRAPAQVTSLTAGLPTAGLPTGFGEVRKDGGADTWLGAWFARGQVPDADWSRIGADLGALYGTTTAAGFPGTAPVQLCLVEGDREQVGEVLRVVRGWSLQPQLQVDLLEVAATTVATLQAQVQAQEQQLAAQSTSTAAIPPLTAGKRGAAAPDPAAGADRSSSKPAAPKPTEPPPEPVRVLLVFRDEAAPPPTPPPTPAAAQPVPGKK